MDNGNSMVSGMESHWACNHPRDIATGTSQDKDLIRRTMVQHVRYKSSCISLPSSTKQQREMTKFCVVWRTRTTTAIFLNFYFEFNAVFHIEFLHSFDNDKQTK